MLEANIPCCPKHTMMFLFLLMHQSLNSSLNCIMTHVDKCILVSFKIIETYFQSIFTTYHNNFLSNVIWSGVRHPKILNKWIPPRLLHSLMGTYWLTSEKNSITFTVLENNWPLNILHFLVVAKMKSLRLIIINANAAIVYQCALQLQFSFSLRLPNMASVPLIAWKAMPVSKAFSFGCNACTW